MTAQDLKNSILQMAVQGKLVPQDPNDEPASVLLQRIQAEKEKLIKAGKLKKEKNPSVIFRGSDNLPYEKVGKEVRCIADAIPFEIPDSWEWVKLTDISKQITDGEHKTPRRVASFQGFFLLSARNIRDGFIALDDVDYVDQEEFELISRRCNPHKGDVLISCSGSVGRICVVEDSRCYVMVRSAAMVSPLMVESHYLMYALQSDFVQQQIQNKIKQAVQANLFQAAIRELCVPIPPFAEQKRIVAKIEEMLPHLDDYNRAETLVKKLNTEFPEKLKKSVLQWAVQGKLVPQDPADEPASELLKRIRAEKAALIKDGKLKKEKNESHIFRRDNSFYEKIGGKEICIDGDIPFDIPDSWEWVRLKNLFNVVSARRVHQNDWRNSGVPFYRAREIAVLAQTGFIDNDLFIDESLYAFFSKSGIPKPNDLMVTAVGTLGKTYIVKENDRFYYKDASVICFENFSKIFPNYMQMVMQTPFMSDCINSESTGTTVGTITIVKAKEYLIPLPPLAEQKRIVEKIEEIFSHL